MTAPSHVSRRQLLASAGVVLGGSLIGPTTRGADSEADSARPNRSPFRYCLNTSTIRSDGLDLPAKIDIAARAGYDGIEPWFREIDEYRQQGGTLDDLRKRIDDAGLTVESAIGFARWIADDADERRQALEQAKREMGTLQQLGGTRMAAPPAGAADRTDFDLFEIAARYRALLELGTEMGIVPQVEVWGGARVLSRLGEAVFVAVESGHPQACLLPDVYHIYKGGSDFAGLRLLGAEAMHVFHVNDYPADPPRESIGDADRVYPGDGVAPLDAIFRSLRDIGFRGALSLELFNRDYWERDPQEVARIGLEKTKAAVARALG